ncbi:methyl-accepting chemotaxis protein [Paenibacillus lactis]|uniref:Methyl-accepting chemotaxis sensory transducer n=3 Tax=Paenibacillus TaxID=44249 RepID=G4H8C8_9BACL|nr:methyl-accepting chemotaxis protein [Paenibacillus lactis]EHB68113.1 methyl-accepting chemotaxis sensory transducer [Paenibacillus lactis 154]MBP1892136.1 methyl-accepting chemotaxis protein [Paenibacillus lactis]
MTLLRKTPGRQVTQGDQAVQGKRVDQGNQAGQNQRTVQAAGAPNAVHGIAEALEDLTEQTNQMNRMNQASQAEERLQDPEARLAPQASGELKEPSMMEYIRTVPEISETETCLDVLELLMGNPGIPCVIYCNTPGNPSGLIMRDAFFQRMMGRFAVDLYYPKPAFQFADLSPTIVEADETVSEVLNLALHRPDDKFYDCIIVKQQEVLAGVLTVRDLMNLSGRLQLDAERKRELILTGSYRHTSNIEASLDDVKAAADKTRAECVRMREFSETGADKLERVSSSYAGLIGDMTRRGDQAEELVRHAGRISSITGTITELANQSSLLAMNASIEAAHAGEHGRGFQVVAGEVQSLAKQTRKLAGDISELLEHIQQLAADTAAAAGSALKELQSCEGDVEEGTRLFYEMQQAVHEVELSGSQVYELAVNTVQRVHQIKEELAGMNASLEPRAEQ